MKRLMASLLVAVPLCGLWACTTPEAAESPEVAPPPPTMVFNIISSGEEDPHPVTMALQLAGHSLDAGRTTVLFFNVRAVTTPTTAFPADVAFGDRPIKELLQDLMDRGAEVHVCPHCMAAMDVEEADLIPGARVTNRDLLFQHLTSNSVVFTY